MAPFMQSPPHRPGGRGGQSGGTRSPLRRSATFLQAQTPSCSMSADEAAVFLQAIHRRAEAHRRDPVARADAGCEFQSRQCLKYRHGRRSLENIAKPLPSSHFSAWARCRKAYGGSQVFGGVASSRTAPWCLERSAQGLLRKKKPPGVLGACRPCIHATRIIATVPAGPIPNQAAPAGPSSFSCDCILAICQMT